MATLNKNFRPDPAFEARIRALSTAVVAAEDAMDKELRSGDAERIAAADESLAAAYEAMGI